MPRETKLTDKDMSVLREGASTRETHDAKRGTIRDYSLKHRITIEWDLNDDAKRDQICRLTIDDYDVLIDAEELMRYVRWV
jgi:hypothetical protein